mgnify:CR=1 FL=1
MTTNLIAPVGTLKSTKASKITVKQTNEQHNKNWKLWSHWSFTLLYLVVPKRAVCFWNKTTKIANNTQSDYFSSYFKKIRTHFKTLKCYWCISRGRFLGPIFGYQSLNLYTRKYSCNASKISFVLLLTFNLIYHVVSQFTAS